MSPQNSPVGVAASLPPLSHPDGSPIRALVVDDERMLSDLIAMGVTMLGWQPHTAADGPSALELARTARPDVLVLDIMIPGFDGLELLRRIRELDADVPCLFLTAKDQVDDRIAGLASGADDYVTSRSPSTRCCCACTAWSSAPGPPWRTARSSWSGTSS